MGLEVVMLIIMEYDHEVLMPLLSIVYNGFTPTFFVAKPLYVGFKKIGWFWSFNLNKGSSHGAF